MKKVVTFMNMVFVIAPIGTALFFSTVYILGGWGFLNPQYAPNHFLLPQLNHLMEGIVLIVAIAVGIWGLWNFYDDTHNKLYKNQITVTAFVLFFLATALSIVLIHLFRNSVMPFSDFYRAWELAHGRITEHLAHYTLFPAYLNYSVFERIIISVAGDLYVNILYCNAILRGITTSAVFIIAIVITHKYTVSLTAGLLYAVMPSGILYSLVGGPDYLTITFNTLGLLFIIVAFNLRGGARYLAALVAGVLLGIGSSFKSFAIIIIIASLITYITEMMCETSSKKKTDEKKRLVAIILTVGIVLAGFSFAEKAVIGCSQKTYGKELDSSYAMPHFFLVGLNTEGEGQIHIGELSHEYNNYYLTNGENYEEAKKHAYRVLKEDWSQNASKIPRLFLLKTIWAWQDDCVPSVYFENNTYPDGDRTERIYNLICDYSPIVSQTFYWAILLMALIGCFSSIKNKDFKFDIEFIKLIVFGYFCLVMLSEAQSRYKCLIMPYLCILAALGVEKIATAIKTSKHN